MQYLGPLIGWILTIFIGLLGALILWQIATHRIDLRYLISDELGYASLSRFQFLVFTFVIAISLFYIIAGRTPPDYPNIPNQILALLGISGGSYVVSKGIQTSRDVSLSESGHPPEVDKQDTGAVVETETKSAVLTEKTVKPVGAEVKENPMT